MNDPIDRIVWRHVDELEANDYNPNTVFTPEMKLLEHSILITGWIQPVLIRAGEKTIIDGFHRWLLSRQSGALRAKYKGMVPTAELDLTRAEAIMLTVRINRAKGTHAALKMSELVHELIDEHGLERKAIATGIGATLDEVDLLYQDGVFGAKKIPDHKYNRAWYPVKEERAKLPG